MEPRFSLVSTADFSRKKTWYNGQLRKLFVDPALEDWLQHHLGCPVRLLMAKIRGLIRGHRQPARTQFCGAAFCEIPKS
eukprot:scaffold54448_cov20-Prasinocladus_malaysianus.AAC.1